MASYQELLLTINQKNVMINNLKMERNWLEEDNNLQRLSVIKYQEKVHEWEVYSQYKNEQTSNELKEVKQAEEEARKLHTKAVEDFGMLKAKYRNLKNNYFALLGKYDQTKKELTDGINIGREIYKECTFYKTQYHALLQYYHQQFKPVEDTERATITEVEADIEMLAKDTAPELVLQNKHNTAPVKDCPEFVRFEIHDIVKEAFRVIEPDRYNFATSAIVSLNNAIVPLNNAIVPLNNAIVPLNKCNIAPSKAHLQLVRFKLPSSAKYTCRVTVQGRDKLPSLHRVADLVAFLLSPKLSRPTGLLAICAPVKNVPSEPPTSSLPRIVAHEMPVAEIKTSNELELCEEIRTENNKVELHETNNEDKGCLTSESAPNTDEDETAKKFPVAQIKMSNEMELCEEIRTENDKLELYERNNEDKGCLTSESAPNSDEDETAKRPASKKNKVRRLFSWLRKHCCCSRPQTTD